MGWSFNIWRVAHKVSGGRLLFPRRYLERVERTERRLSVRSLFRRSRIGALSRHRRYEIVCPLASVRQLAEKADAVVADSPNINNLFEETALQASGWTDVSPSYPPPYIAEFHEVLVHTGSATLINADGVAMNDELYFSVHQISSASKTPKIQPLSEGGISIHFDRVHLETVDQGLHLLKEYQANYFHWLAEVMPRLFVCEKYGVATDIPILTLAGIHPNLLELLNLLRNPDRPVLALPPNVICRVRRLVYPSDTTRILTVYDRPPSTDTAYLPVNLLAEMAKFLKKRLHLKPPSNRERRLYVRRNSQYRLLLNQRSIEAALTELGFEIVDPADLSIGLQAETFSEASTIVAPSGAGLANMLWCEPSTRILVLHSDHPFKSYPYWNALASVSNSEISYLSGPRAFKQQGLYATHDDFTINPDSVVASVQQMLG